VITYVQYISSCTTKVNCSIVTTNLKSFCLKTSEHKGIYIITIRCLESKFPSERFMYKSTFSVTSHQFWYHIYIYMRVWLKEEKFCSYWQPQNKEYELLNWNFPSSHLLDSTNSIRKYLRELAYQNLVETNHNFYCYGLQNLIILKFKNIRTLVLKFNSSLILMFQHRLNSSL
jgi:hypothetical protein